MKRVVQHKNGRASHLDNLIVLNWWGGLDDGSLSKRIQYLEYYKNILGTANFVTNCFCVLYVYLHVFK